MAFVAGNSLLDEQDDAPETGAKSACLACSGRTRAIGDMLCADCWPKVDREVKWAWNQAWNGVRFSGLPQKTLDTATANLVASARGQAIAVTPVEATSARKTVTRECSQCHDEFTFTPGNGRPPLRCRECRGLARYDVTPAVKMPARAPSVAVVVASPAPLPVSKIEPTTTQIRALIAKDIAEHEHRLTLLRRADAALADLETHFP